MAKWHISNWVFKRSTDRVRRGIHILSIITLSSKNITKKKKKEYTVPANRNKNHNKKHEYPPKESPPTSLR